jgi:hypothetical protein
VVSAGDLYGRYLGFLDRFLHWTIFKSLIKTEPSIFQSHDSTTCETLLGLSLTLYFGTDSTNFLLFHDILIGLIDLLLWKLSLV